MGNEKSALSGLDIDEKAVEIADFWLHHSATLTSTASSQSLSVFISEPSLHSAANFGKPSPLEKTAKNLMLHRHPCILKYVSSWKKGSSYYLSTEEAKPLSQCIGNQTTLQICIGLHSILRALIFLHDNALASHNNICSSSIYVTPEGSWKLGCFEFLCRFSDFNQAYLKKIKTFRYEKAIAPEESNDSLVSQINPISIDIFAFGVLVEEILRPKNTDDVPGLLEFKELARQQLQNQDPELRPKLNDIIKHAFFTHDFINIHAFLIELPLKNQLEKEEFFSSLLNQLKKFPEKIVAEQLGRLLLSRMVLLDSTAQSKLLPYVLKPKTEDDNDHDVDNESGLFTISTFKSYLVPKLLQMFCVRDTCVRLILLAHLNSYIYAFQIDELKKKILPELLVGIKDHDDHLVSITLRALSDLVPILGATAVIGGKRGKLFTDGRPNHDQTRRDVCSIKKINELKSIDVKASDDIVEESILELPERPSPDGGEDDMIQATVNYSEEEGTWSDWEVHEIPNGEITSLKSIKETYIETEISPADINELDIKHSKPIQSAKEEVDFFTDMEPVIEKPRILHVDNVHDNSNDKINKSVFDFKENLIDNEAEDYYDNGWGDDLNDWGNDNKDNNNVLDELNEQSAI
ncbi:protein-associating with the carboxyl-terminal domain of ezrin isoform X2 [Aphidius gifuensis]|uniref:protein-associating with the carboxyl-terminal domain of ezrin isoform X2 n=1 Tax=Aphidius gifuensis TaxID=684658 RepID=UPI001CDBAEDF|nr:protein-associating with the carboxyl-terminal domain of ezrin isoform X2 [Aphidius gifuensis]